MTYKKSNLTVEERLIKLLETNNLIPNYVGEYNLYSDNIDEFNIQIRCIDGFIWCNEYNMCAYYKLNNDNALYYIDVED